MYLLGFLFCGTALEPFTAEYPTDGPEEMVSLSCLLTPCPTSWQFYHDWLSVLNNWSANSGLATFVGFEWFWWSVLCPFSWMRPAFPHLTKTFFLSQDYVHLDYHEAHFIYDEHFFLLMKVDIAQQLLFSLHKKATLTLSHSQSCLYLLVRLCY